MKDIILGLIKDHPVCDFSNFNKLLKFLTADPAVRAAAGEMKLTDVQDMILDILSNQNPWSVIISH